MAQCRLSRAQRRPRGNDNVYDEHAPAGGGGRSPEDGTVQPLDTVAAGLRCATVVAFEQSPAWQPELSRHSASDDLGLVESTPVAAAGAGGRPPDHVEGSRPHAGGDEGGCGGARP